MPSKSKKYSRKRNYRKRRHSRRMQRKSRSRNAYAYNRRRRTMFGGAPPEGVYKITADKEGDKLGLDILAHLGYLEYSDDTNNPEYVSTTKFNDDFKQVNETDVSATIEHTITLTPDGDNYKVNVKFKHSLEGDDPGMNFTFTKRQ